MAVFYRRKTLKNELVIVLDFGGQYNQLVARRVRECNVYCEIYSYRTDIEKIKEMNPKGIILTGGPNSCYLPDSPTYSDELFKLGIPVDLRLLPIRRTARWRLLKMQSRTCMRFSSIRRCFTRQKERR